MSFSSERHISNPGTHPKCPRRRILTRKLGDVRSHEPFTTHQDTSSTLAVDSFDDLLKLRGQAHPRLDGTDVALQVSLLSALSVVTWRSGSHSSS